MEEEDAILGDLDKSMEQEGSQSTSKRSKLHRIKSKVAQPKPKPIIEDSEEFDDIVFNEIQQQKSQDLDSSLSSPKKRLKRLAQLPNDSFDKNDTTEEHIDTVRPQCSAGRRTRQSRANVSEEEEEKVPEEDDFVEVVPPQRRSPTKRSQTKRYNDVSDFVVDDEDDEEPDPPQRKPAHRGKKAKSYSASESDGEIDQRSYEEDVSARRSTRSKKATAVDLTPLKHKRIVDLKPSPLLNSVRARLGKASTESASDVEHLETEAPEPPSKSVQTSPRKGRGGSGRDQLVLDLVNDAKGYKEKAMNDLDIAASALGPIDLPDGDDDDDFMKEAPKIVEVKPHPQPQPRVSQSSRIKLAPATSPSKLSQPGRPRQTKLNVTLESLKKPVESSQQPLSQPTTKLKAKNGKINLVEIDIESPTSSQSMLLARAEAVEDDPLLRELADKYSNLTQRIANLASEQGNSKRARNAYNYSDSEDEHDANGLNASGSSRGGEAEDQMLAAEKERKRLKGQLIVQTIDKSHPPSVAPAPKKKPSIAPITALDAPTSQPATRTSAFDDVNDDMVVLDIVEEESTSQPDKLKRLKRKRNDSDDDYVNNSQEPPALAQQKSPPLPERRLKRTKIDSFFSPSNVDNFDSQFSEMDEYEGEFLKNPSRSSKRSEAAREAARERYREEKEDERDEYDDEDMNDFMAGDDEVDSWSEGDLPDQEDRQQSDEESSADYTQQSHPFVSVHMNMKESMEIYIQFLIMGTLSPDEAAEALQSEKPGKTKLYFKPAIKKVRDNILEKGSNIMSSSAWQPEFEHDLRCLPHYKSHQVDYMADTCQACKRKNHTSSHSVAITGIAYDPLVFWDGDFEKINDYMDCFESTAPGDMEENTYNLGRFCYRRTSIYHSVLHFPFRLLRRIRRKLADVERVLGLPLLMPPWLPEDRQRHPT
eukprot:TRINITY_DN8356_c0_g1_i1.p1 TRINITY_DN8356_c0_g1~~TRINITY_DN8356_c0_g1_i1.p1  ORF type:complete len:931 (-),score=217.50 TRINITY_DN8356_c0_g1_i1:16-2808(-)